MVGSAFLCWLTVSDVPSLWKSLCTRSAHLSQLVIPVLPVQTHVLTRYVSCASPAVLGTACSYFIDDVL